MSNLPSDLIWEVLVRLTAKSLMRFKCVSKQWYSKIRDPKFAIVHGGIGSFQGFVIHDIHHKSVFITEQILLSVNLHDDCQKLMHHITLPQPEYEVGTPVVKGLMGWYNEHNNEFTLCNIATHQFLKLPPSPTCIDSDDIEYFHFYFLGFDVDKGVFKVLSLCRRFDENHHIIAQLTHVFTLGVNNNSDTNWREIDPAPLDLCFEMDYVCINGSLYWPSDDQLSLLAFHLNNETFEQIPVPDCAIGWFVLGQICGRPTLLKIRNGGKVMDIWTMNEHGRGGERQAWSRKAVSLPTTLFKPRYAGTTPEGQMMLVPRNSVNLLFDVFLYDHLTNDILSLTLEGEGTEESADDRNRLMVCYYEENIICLDHLINNQEHDQQLL